MMDCPWGVGTMIRQHPLDKIALGVDTVHPEVVHFERPCSPLLGSGSDSSRKY